jgi:RHS repeat-associated protein
MSNTESGALQWSYFDGSSDITMTAYNSDRLQILGVLVENNVTPASGNFQLYYEPASAAEAVVDQNTGDLMLAGQTAGRAVSSGVAYVDGGRTFVYNQDSAKYKLSYTDAAGEGVVRDGAFEAYVKNHLGSTMAVVCGTGQFKEATAYMPYGMEQPLLNAPADERAREKFTGKEFDGDIGINLTYFGARYYDPQVGVWTSPDPVDQLFNTYGYSTNPINTVDADGRFLTWSFGRHGFSIGINLIWIGIPWGCGINVGWSHGGSIGAYTEIGPRVGGTGLGAGATVRENFDIGFQHGNVSETTTESADASFVCFNANASVSESYDATKDKWNDSWGVGAGIGIGDGDNNGNGSFGLSVGYGGSLKGQDGWSWDCGFSFNNQSSDKSDNSVPKTEEKAASNDNSLLAGDYWKPPKNWQTPTNPPQMPPAPEDIPDGYRVRQMPPDEGYENGYWKLEKLQNNGGWQPVDPSTGKPGSGPCPPSQEHVPFPPGKAPSAPIIIPPIFRMPIMPLIPYDQLYRMINPYYDKGA